MSTLREKLQAELARYDDDAFAALANRGLLRRARKDLEKQAAEIVAESAQELTLSFGGQQVHFDARGAAHARCSCPASGVCQHILAAAISLQSRGASSATTPAATTMAPATAPATASTTSDAAPPAVTTPPADALEELRAALLRMTAPQLAKHCGKAGYRWAWQFVHDLDAEQDLSISGERNLIIGFRHPRVSFRYMGGTVDSLIGDADLKQIEKYRVAAVLAYQRAHGATLVAPESPAPAAALDLGKDHAASEGSAASLQESRRRLYVSVRELARECITLGLAHFSPGIQERFATLAVWAQGAQTYRLAMLLRRLADHVEMLLDRAGGADEHRLFDELTLAFGMVAALYAAAGRGMAPATLIGRARNEYEDAGQVELLGLGAHAWRSPSGYIGLTMLFWAPRERSFFTCGDARPEIQRGFDPVARYKAAGPWSGLGAPAVVTGRRVVLTGTLLSATGRISGSEKTTATVMPRDAGDFLAKLESHSRWSELARIRADARRSLLAEHQPMRDWVTLRPTRFGSASFDAARQTLVWPLFDDQGEVLHAELAYDKYTTHAIERLEQLDVARIAPGTLLVARLRGGSTQFVAEPLSLIGPEPRADGEIVDALFFDDPPKVGLANRLLARLRSRPPDAAAAPVQASAVPALLRELRQWLIRQAERGVAFNAAAQARSELAARRERLLGAGFTAFRGSGDTEDMPGELLRMHYLCMQCEHLLDDPGDAQVGLTNA